MTATLLDTAPRATGTARPATGPRIGDVTLRSPVAVAPMAGITGVPFRRIAAEMGAGLVTTEMVAAEAVVRSVEATLHLLDFPTGPAAPECPVAAQLVGCRAEVMAEAARIAVDRGAQMVDVNLGCPVRKVVGLGSGAALARDVRATASVLSAMVRAVEPAPVTAKMRLGWDHHTINAPELARALEDVGVRAVTVHGRTRNQGYSGLADWAEIGRVKEAVDIPVFGSGDVTDPGLVAHRIDAGLVDGVIVARGMLGDFWLVRRMAGRLRGEAVADQPFAERMALTRRHVLALVDYHGERRALKLGRKYVAWAIRGCNGAARLRAAVQDLDSLERLEELLGMALAAGPRPEGIFRPVFTSGEG